MPPRAVVSEQDFPAGPAFERHYTVKELALLWHLGVDTVRAMFENEPGVLRVDRPETVHKRAYCTMRIPESVARRVYRKWTCLTTSVQ